MRCKLVIFDLDGTLLCTLGDIAFSINKVLVEFGLPVHPEESFKKFVGYGLLETLKRASPVNCSPDILSKAFERVMEEYRAAPVISTKPYPGIPELLDSLSDLSISIAVLSNKEDGLVKEITGKLLSGWSFVSVRGTVSGIPPKPDPSGVTVLSKDLNYNRDEIIFVGDSGVDMRTAANAGVMGVGVSWGYRNVSELTESGASVIIDKPAELLKIVN